ncbi:uncharacterized protein FOMMEDRAFT_23283 [Fomitiporia mediterranea MF3/22]|uniref:uncharacterized protein n=1 Tax=Fomitiporia mediterranea (strain MF3/22) TaxID=694068 RepID=UPI00044086C9|nr:uncharacterized protein FOMMEDRAFT_23283 [Fomitiporia mediterranea MF3/22]EJC98882.1 hypothetical protein FOMMEDRAFT_23283 [Fomitiporia mediterranea MF3/22]
MKQPPPSLSFVKFARSYATRRAVKPSPKIVDPLTTSPNAEIAHFPDGLTFIHRPPPTAPSPFSTTVLPASPLLAQSTKANTAESSSTEQSTQSTVSVPPRMRNERKFPSNRVLSEADFTRMRELRASNPSYYTRGRLAKEFNCPPFLVAQQVPLDRRVKKETIEKLETEHEKIRSQWGEQKTMAMAVRKRRREFW